MSTKKYFDDLPTRDFKAEIAEIDRGLRGLLIFGAVALGTLVALFIYAVGQDAKIREHCRETHAADYAALQNGITDPHWSGAMHRRLKCAKVER